MSSRELGTEARREGVRRTFTQNTPRSELRPDDVVAMESFKQHRHKTGESDAGLRPQSGPSGLGTVADVVQPTSGASGREMDTNPQTIRISDTNNAKGLAGTLSPVNTVSNETALSSTSTGSVPSQKPCPQVVLVQVPRKALAALKKALGEARFMKVSEVDSEELLVTYAENEDAWDSISKICAMDILPRKRVVTLSLSIGGGASAWLSLNVQIKGVVAIAALLIFLAACLAFGWGARLPREAYYRTCETATISTCAKSYLEGGKQYLFSVASFPYLVKEFFRTSPVRVHRALNRVLQDLLLRALQNLGESQDGSAAARA